MENINYPQTLDQYIEKFSSADTWDAFNSAITESKSFIESDDGESNPFLAQACEESFVRLTIQDQKTTTVETIYYIPILFEKCQYNIKSTDFWVSYRDALLNFGPQFALKEIISRIVLSTVMDAVLTNRWVALPKMITLILQLPVERQLEEGQLDTVHVQNLGICLAANGWFHSDSGLRKSLIDTWGKCRGTNNEIIKWLVIILPLLGFNKTKTSPVDWLTFLFDIIIYPLITVALQTNRFRLALDLEEEAYKCYVQKIETADFFKSSYVQKILPLFLEAGRKHRTTLPTIPPVDINASRPKVCFILDNSEFLAHTRVLFNYFKGLKELGYKSIQPILIMLHDISEEVQNLVDELQIGVVSFTDPGYYAKISQIREWCISNGVVACVKVSTVLLMPFAYSIRLAPVQIYWSMKYHSVEFDEIDGYLATGSFEKYRTINGRKWRVGHGALDSLYKPKLENAAIDKRKELTDNEDCIIFGWMGRETNINSSEYAEALAQILKRVPNSMYIWTGRVNHPEISARFRKLGILDRCKFVGWVNTALYAQMIDVYVDSFPFASGHTAVESMAAGCPVVVRITTESLESSSLTSILPAFHSNHIPKDIQEDIKRTWLDENGNMLLPIVEDFDNYVNMAIRLAVDRDFRHRIGELSRMFVSRFMTNTQLMAETYTNHILDIINQSRKS